MNYCPAINWHCKVSVKRFKKCIILIFLFVRKRNSLNESEHCL